MDNNERKKGYSINYANYEFKYELREWAINSNISHNMLKHLMNILHTITGAPFLQQDPMTLLETPFGNVSIQAIANGSYWHHSIQTCLESAFKNNEPPETILLNINIDGIYLSHRSTTVLADIRFVFLEESCRHFLYITIKCISLREYSWKPKYETDGFWYFLRNVEAR